jgi:hypothetical protein
LSSPGGEETGEGGRQNQIHSAVRPSQNEYRKRVPVRLHQISVIASASCASPREIMFPPYFTGRATHPVAPAEFGMCSSRRESAQISSPPE